MCESRHNIIQIHNNVLWDDNVIWDISKNIASPT